MTNKINVITAGISKLQDDFDESMDELSALCTANDMAVISVIKQNKDHPSAGTYFGKGKLEEIKHLAEEKDVKTLVVNDTLSPSQIRNIEKETDLQVIDRNELILEIFSNRAQTNQAKLQVKLARLKYELPRIHPSENNLDQQSAGGSNMSNRGAGESQLELERRTIRDQIDTVNKRLKKIKVNQNTQTTARANSEIPTVALVGYTNSGKSTTMNSILNFNKYTNEDKKVEEKDMLFATLDTSVRQVRLKDNTRFLLSDTVGFVSNLPHDLVEAFQATLSEAKNADLIINVVDYSSKNWERDLKVTKKTLSDLGVDNSKSIYAFNKSDKLDMKIPEVIGNNIYYSAFKDDSVAELLKLIKANLYKDNINTEIFVPFTDQATNNYLLNNVIINDKSYSNDGATYQVSLTPAQETHLQKILDK